MPISIQPMKRREFLAGTVATGLLAMTWTGQNALASDSRQNHWVFLSDTHIPGGEDNTRSGTYPVDHFQIVRDEILALENKPQGIIVTGDVAFLKGKLEDYQMIRKLVGPFLEAGIPFHVAFGNHDNLENFYAAFSDLKKEDSLVASKHVHVLETPHCNLFLLDSLYDNDFGAGFFGTNQLRWLKKELAARKDKPAVLFAHHNLDERPGTLMDRAEFWQLVKGQPYVKAYVYGHTHIYRNEVRDNVQLINLPALGWEFESGKQPLGWTDVMITDSGLKMTLHTVNKEHPKNGDVREFTWLR